MIPLRISSPRRSGSGFLFMHLSVSCTIIAMRGESERFLFEKVSAWLLVACWAAVIFLLSAAPGNPQQEPTVELFVLRKGAHIFEYALLSFLLVRALIFGKVAFAEVLAALLSLLYAFSDEFHQLYVPLREGMAADILFDAAGIAVGIFLYSVWSILRSQTKK